MRTLRLTMEDMDWGQEKVYRVETSIPMEVLSRMSPEIMGQELAHHVACLMRHLLSDKRKKEFDSSAVQS